MPVAIGPARELLMLPLNDLGAGAVVKVLCQPLKFKHGNGLDITLIVYCVKCKIIFSSTEARTRTFMPAC